VKDVFGNTTGLKASLLRMAERVYRRRVKPAEVISPELGGFLCDVAVEMGRQVGVLLDRRGQVDHVIIGDSSKLDLPDIGRLRAGRGRLRGLRLVHTHLHGEPLTVDDLTDLSLLRLDLVAAISLGSAASDMRHVHVAHLLPENPEGKLWTELDPVPLHELGQLDFEELVRSLEDEFARASRVLAADQGKDRALLVHVRTRQTPRSESACLAELRELCRTASVTVLDVIVQRRVQLDPRYVVGRGKIDEIVQRANQLGAELLIFDPDLTPGQARAITQVTELKVLDRTMLILDIFAQRARSRDGKVQVELAQLSYTLPRLAEKNTMMSRLTGGIGGRGPGETKLEINRRRARERIRRLEQQIEQLSRRREQRRSLRHRRGMPVVSIIGYTNAGKSTLLNTLTSSRELVEDKLFATLDPTSRRLRFPREREILLTDTVGFIHDLPRELVNAFRATLEEVAEADLLVHLVDAADHDFADQIRAVEQIVADLGLAQTPRLLVFNKCDRLAADELALRMRGHGDALAIVAPRPETTRPLLAAMERALWREEAIEEEPGGKRIERGTGNGEPGAGKSDRTRTG
jgi:GTP-binding protein HflX